MGKSLDGDTSGGGWGRSLNLDPQFFKREFDLVQSHVGEGFDLDPSYKEPGRFSLVEEVSVFDVVVEMQENVIGKIKQFLIRLELGENLSKPNISRVVDLRYLREEAGYKIKREFITQGHLGIVRDRVSWDEFEAVVNGVRVFLFSLLSFDYDYQIRSKEMSEDELEQLKDERFEGGEYLWEAFVQPILMESFRGGFCDARILGSLSIILSEIEYSEDLNQVYKAKFKKQVLFFFNHLSEFFWGVSYVMRDNVLTCYQGLTANNLFYKVKV